MAEWRRVLLGEVIELKRGYDLPTPTRKSGSIPVVSSSGVTGCHDEAKVQAPGVVIGRYGTLGQVFFIREPFWPLNTALYVRDFKGNDPRFVAYALTTLNYQAAVDKAAVPGVNRNDLHRFPVLWPSLPVQRAIAHILGTLDDKIELNGQMNETLEAIARAIFKSWLVDFDPVRAKVAGRDPPGMDAETAALFPDAFEESPLGKIPRGWGVASLDEVADFLNGLALQKFPPTGEGDLPVIKIAELRRGDTARSDRANSHIPPGYVVDDGDVLFSWSGSLEVCIWTGGLGALNQHLFKVTSRLYPKWFYYFWLKEYLPDFQAIASGKATTMGHIQRHHLTEAKVLVPPSDLLARAGAAIGPMIEMRVSNKIEARTLAAIRDTLLPKLISGEARIPDAGRVFERVT